MRHNKRGKGRVDKALPKPQKDKMLKSPPYNKAALGRSG
jgi:hypothetical protein